MFLSVYSCKYDVWRQVSDGVIIIFLIQLLYREVWPLRGRILPYWRCFVLTIEKILPKRILSIYSSKINELDFQFLLRRKYKDQTVSFLFCK